MADPSQQYSIDLKLPSVPYADKNDPNWEDLNALYNATQMLALAIETINARLTTAGIP